MKDFVKFFSIGLLTLFIHGISISIVGFNGITLIENSSLISKDNYIKPYKGAEQVEKEKVEHLARQDEIIREMRKDKPPLYYYSQEAVLLTCVASLLFSFFNLSFIGVMLVLLPVVFASFWYDHLLYLVFTILLFISFRKIINVVK